MVLSIIVEPSSWTAELEGVVVVGDALGDNDI